jgi:hypothetical protein
MIVKRDAHKNTDQDGAARICTTSANVGNSRGHGTRLTYL